MASNAWISPTQEEAAAADLMAPWLDVELTVRGLPHVAPGEVRKLVRRYRLVDGHSVFMLELDVVRKALSELLSDHAGDEGQNDASTVPPFELLYANEYVLDEALYDQLTQVAVAPPMQHMALSKRLSVPAPKFGRPLAVTVNVKSKALGGGGMSASASALPSQRPPAVGQLSASALNQLSSGELKAVGTPASGPTRDSNAVQPLGPTADNTSRGVKVARIDELSPSMYRGHFTVQGTIIHVKPGTTLLDATLYQPDPNRAGSGSRISVVCFDSALVRRLGDVFREGRIVRLENVTARAKSEADRRAQTNGHPCRLIVDMHSQVVDLGVQSGDLKPDVVSREAPPLGNQGGVLTSSVVGFMRSAPGGSSAAASTAGASALRPANRHALPVRVDQGTMPLNAQLLRAAANGSATPSHAGGASSYAVSTVAGPAPSLAGASNVPLPKRTIFTPSSAASARSGPSGAGTSNASVSAHSGGAGSGSIAAALPAGERRLGNVSRADIESRDAVLHRTMQAESARAPRTVASKECIFCGYNLEDADSVARLVKRINEETPHHTRDGKSSVKWSADAVLAVFRDQRPGVGKLAGRLYCRAVLRDPIGGKPYRAHPRCAHVCTVYQRDGELDDVCTHRAACDNCHRKEALVDCYEPTCRKTYCIICSLFADNLVNFGRNDPSKPCPACPGHTQILMDGAMRSKRSRADGGADGSPVSLADRTMFDSAQVDAWVRDPDVEDE